MKLAQVLIFTFTLKMFLFFHCYYTVPKLLFNLQEFMYKLFSGKCQLTSLPLDISNDDPCLRIHEFCLSSCNIHQNLIHNELFTYCITFRHLHIHLIFGSMLDNIINHVPALETFSIQFENSLFNEWLYPKVKKSYTSIVNWYNKVTRNKA